MKQCEAALPVPCWCARENILPKEKARVSLRVVPAGKATNQQRTSGFISAEALNSREQVGGN